MPELKRQIEAILLFKNEPMTWTDISKALSVPKEEARAAVEALQSDCADRGIIIVISGEEVMLGTHPDMSALIERVQKEELSRDLGRAGLETLAIVLYKGPVSRREIDNIRGVNSSFIIRNLLIRGLIERTESAAGERSFSYRPTLELMRYLGVTKIEDLPRYKEAFAKMEEFVKNDTSDADQ